MSTVEEPSRMFADRDEGGRALAAALGPRDGASVWAIARGGVVVGAVVARLLGLPLDVVVPRKLRAPGNPELGIGAVAPGGVVVLDRRLIEALGVPDEYVRQEIASQVAEIERRARSYGRDRPSPVARGTCLIVDDGLATGATAAAAGTAARDAGAEVVVLGVPIGPPGVPPAVAAAFDEVLIVQSPPGFVAVGQGYASFPQVEDDEVLAALHAA